MGFADRANRSSNFFIASVGPNVVQGAKPLSLYFRDSSLLPLLVWWRIPVHLLFNKPLMQGLLLGRHHRGKITRFETRVDIYDGNVGGAAVDHREERGDSV